MKVSLTKTIFLLLTMCFSLLISYSRFTDLSFVNYQGNTPCECPDISDVPVDTPHSCFEDDVFINDSNIVSGAFFSKVDFVIPGIFNFIDCYTPVIWQPPKFS
jgi:hypothetical protein